MPYCQRSDLDARESHLDGWTQVLSGAVAMDDVSHLKRLEALKASDDV